MNEDNAMKVVFEVAFIVYYLHVILYKLVTCKICIILSIVHFLHTCCIELQFAFFAPTTINTQKKCVSLPYFPAFPYLCRFNFSEP